jgi:hypothetical protein
MAPHGHSRKARNWTVLFENLASAKWPSHTGPRCDRNMSRNVHTIPSLPVLSIIKLTGGCAPALLLFIHTLVVRALFLIVASELRAPEVPGGTKADISVSICRQSNVSLSVTELSESEYSWKKGFLDFADEQDMSLDLVHYE